MIKFAILGMHMYLESTTMKTLSELARRGHDVTFVAGSTWGSVQRFGAPFNLEIVRFPKWLPVISLIYFEFAALHRLLKRIAEVDVVILDFNSLPMLFPVLWLKRLLSRTPVLFFHVESNIVNMGSPLRTTLCVFIDAFATKLAAGAFDRILFSSPMLGDFYHEKYNVPREKIAVWPNVADLDFSESVDSSRVRELRKELGLDGHFSFLYHGAVRTQELLSLVQAFKILAGSSPNLTLVILGYGIEKESFFRYVREHDLDRNVKLRGPVDHSEVSTYIAACDAGITPMPDNIDYRYQNPIKVLELLAMNKPIVASDIPAHRWIIGNSTVALYLKGTDPISIAEGVQAFLASFENLDPKLGEKIVRERFTPEKVADTLENQIRTCQTDIRRRCDA